MSKPAGCRRKSNPKVMFRCAMLWRALLPSHNTNVTKARTANICQAQARTCPERIHAGPPRGRPRRKAAMLIGSTERERKIEPPVSPQIIQSTRQFQPTRPEIVVVNLAIVTDRLDGARRPIVVDSHQLAEAAFNSEQSANERICTALLFIDVRLV